MNPKTRRWFGSAAAATAALAIAGWSLSNGSASDEPVHALARELAPSHPAASDVLVGQATGQSEFDAALQRTADCISDAGFTAVVDPGAGLRPGTVRFTATSDDEFRRGMPVHKACMAEHLDAVAVAWGYQLYQQRPAETVLDAARADCMRANGADVGPTFTAIQVRDLQVSGNDPDDLLGAYGACLRPLQEQYGAY